MNEDNGFVLKPEMYNRNEWYQMYLSMLKECKKMQQENSRLKDKENKIIKKLESYNLDYLHETNEHNLADTIEYLLELLKEN